MGGRRRVWVVGVGQAEGQGGCWGRRRVREGVGQAEGQEGVVSGGSGRGGGWRVRVVGVGQAEGHIRGWWVLGRHGGGGGGRGSPGAS